jgi:hypothetical protein
MKLYLHRPETKTVWCVKFNTDFEMLKIYYNNIDVTKRLDGSCFEKVLFDAYDDKLDLNYEKYRYINNLY